MKPGFHDVPESFEEAMCLVEEMRARNEALVREAGELGAVVESLSRQLEEVHAEHENVRMFMSAIDQCSESIFFTDLTGRILYVNRSFENNSGYTRAELIGETPRILKSGVHSSEFYQEMWEVILRGEIWRSRMTNRRKDGSLYHEEANIAPVRNDEGEITSFVCVKTDITELLGNKRALEAANAELSRSNLELEQFAYVASHDLQEPLRAVITCMQLLEKQYHEGLDDRAREFIRHGVDACHRMRDLIEGLLTLSRVQVAAGQLEPTDTRRIIDEVCVNLASAIEESGARIVCGELPVVCAHRQMLLHLFQNLISNAIKFSGTSLPVVHASAKRENGQWVFSIKDSGIGIDEMHFERIFQLFQRLHTREEYPGTGLGLAICRKITDHHGGRIWVDSKPGEGANFHFTLPAVQEPTTSWAIPKNPCPPMKNEQRNHSYSAS
jgi:two-component system, chemotaxis family, sensor kinase Cph1